jgi:hypothetical protein
LGLCIFRLFAKAAQDGDSEKRKQCFQNAGALAKQLEVQNALMQNKSAAQIYAERIK